MGSDVTVIWVRSVVRKECHHFLEGFRLSMLTSLLYQFRVLKAVLLCDILFEGKASLLPEVFDLCYKLFDKI